MDRTLLRPEPRDGAGHCRTQPDAFYAITSGEPPYDRDGLIPSAMPSRRTIINGSTRTASAVTGDLLRRPWRLERSEDLRPPRRRTRAEGRHDCLGTASTIDVAHRSLDRRS